jgi:hypothetical protein
VDWDEVDPDGEWLEEGGDFLYCGARLDEFMAEHDLCMAEDLGEFAADLRMVADVLDDLGDVMDELEAEGVDVEGVW